MYRNAFLVFLVLTQLAVLPVSTQAEPIYVVKGKNGRVVFTNRKVNEKYNPQVFKPGRHVSYYRTGLRYSGSGFRARPMKSQFDALISQVAARRGLDPLLVKAVIHVESAFNSRARSPKGAMGLMQLMPGTARLVGCRNPWSPEDNIKGGVRYLASMLSRYSGNTSLALAAYNAGPGAVDNHRGIPPYRETQLYVRRVLSLHKAYKSLKA